MKDIGTTVDMTTIPLGSLKSTPSNKVHTTLQSDQSSHIKQDNKSNNRESEGEGGQNEGDRRGRWEMTRGERKNEENLF